MAGKQKQQGFSLVELMVTLAIAIILLTVSVPSLTAMYHNQQSKSQVESIKQHISYARSLALSYGKNMVVCPIKNVQECSQDWQQDLGIFELTSNQSKTLIQRLTVSTDNHELKPSDPTINKFTFNSNGQVNAGDLSYCLKGKNQADCQKITIHANGRIESNPKDELQV